MSDFMGICRAVESSGLLESEDLFLGASPEEDGMVLTFLRGEKEIALFAFMTPSGWVAELFDSPEL